jgi:hypothetical protein
MPRGEMPPGEMQLSLAPFDAFPLWVFFVGAMACALLSLEMGFRLGRWRHDRVVDEKAAAVGTMVAAILGLLAFMLAFTFGMATSRFDARRQIVLEESNAIGTAYLRARLLPEPQRSEIGKLLRDYVDVRIGAVEAQTLAEGRARSEKLQEQLWSQATAAAEKNPASIMTGLFIQSLNEVIDVHAKRLVAVQSRIPSTIWITLFALTVSGMVSTGYQAGLSATRRSPEVFLLVLAFACVLYLVVDFDRAHEGLLRVSQQSMLDLQQSMKAQQP